MVLAMFLYGILCPHSFNERLTNLACSIYNVYWKILNFDIEFLFNTDDNKEDQIGLQF
jgi:hypothetical protein